MEVLALPKHEQLFLLFIIFLWENESESRKKNKQKKNLYIQKMI